MDEKVCALAQRILDHAKGMVERERMAYLARMLWGSTYGWGDEVVGSTDCSGSVFWALWLMGYPVRVTAHELYAKWTVPLDGEPVAGNLAFWWDDKKGRVVHVAIFTDNGIILNASPPEMHDVPLEEEVKKRAYRDLRLAQRRLDFKALKEDRENGTLKAWGVSEGLKAMFGIAGG